MIWKHKGRSVDKINRNPISAITLLNARVKQFFAEDRSPFFQMQLPKHSQASASDGFNLTWNMEQPSLKKNSTGALQDMALLKLTISSHLQLSRDDPLLPSDSLEIHPISFLSDIHMLHAARVIFFVLPKDT